MQYGLRFPLKCWIVWFIQPIPPFNDNPIEERFTNLRNLISVRRVMQHWRGVVSGKQDWVTNPLRHCKKYEFVRNLIDWKWEKSPQSVIPRSSGTEPNWPYFRGTFRGKLLETETREEPMSPRDWTLSANELWPVQTYVNCLIMMNVKETCTDQQEAIWSFLPD